MKPSASHQALKRLIPPLAAWIVGKLLENPQVKGAMQEVDSRVAVRRHNAVRSVKRASRNAASNPAWLVAGAAAIAVGIGLMAKASRGR